MMGAAEFDVVCAGHAVVDVLIRGDFDSMFEHDGELEQAVISVGGDALNEAVVLSKLGLRSAFLGKVGKDPAGDLIIAQLEKSLVDTGGVITDKQVDTTVSVIPVDDNGRHHFWCYQGGNNRICRDIMREEYIERTRVLNIGSIIPGSDMDFEGVAEACAKARKKGVITSADAVLTAPFWGSKGYAEKAERLSMLLRELDYFLPSEEEASGITGEKDVRKAFLKLLEMGAGQVVIKMGKKGCLVRDGGKFEIIPGYQVEAADTVGAGDNFVAGFTAGLSKGWSLRQCAMFANAAAAISVTQEGAVKAAADFDTVRRFMKENGEGDKDAWNW